jgi:hypothetical protein
MPCCAAAAFGTVAYILADGDIRALMARLRRVAAV